MVGEGGRGGLLAFCCWFRNRWRRWSRWGRGGRRGAGSVDVVVDIDIGFVVGARGCGKRQEWGGGGGAASVVVVPSFGFVRIFIVDIGIVSL